MQMGIVSLYHGGVEEAWGRSGGELLSCELKSGAEGEGRRTEGGTRSRLDPLCSAAAAAVVQQCKSYRVRATG